MPVQHTYAREVTQVVEGPSSASPPPTPLALEDQVTLQGQVNCRFGAEGGGVMEEEMLTWEALLVGFT